jgi:hypothetical protein
MMSSAHLEHLFLLLLVSAMRLLESFLSLRSVDSRRAVDRDLTRRRGRWVRWVGKDPDPRYSLLVLALAVLRILAQ